MGPGMMVPLLLLWTRGSQESTLDPTGQHVCRGDSPSELQCCPGWRQKDQECSIPVCEGPDACRKDEVCVKPGLCRCKPGFFGAQCSSPCPGQYWGHDCRETCPCHPRGKCEPATGVCHCQPTYWGTLCEFPCTCGPHGQCDPKTGVCHCDPGWWSSTCLRPCQCKPVARCDQATGACLCPSGWWGRRCGFRCNCHTSPCQQDSGHCICLKGWWGPECSRRCQCVRGQCSVSSGHCSCPPGFHGARCELPCDPGHYGAQCRESCGHCAPNATCSPVTGNCESCKPGWNGTQCKQPCPPGTFGERCGEQCPRCWLGEPCHAETGHCQRCDPGWLGDRCENPCPSGSFGEGCSSTCPACVQGTCDAVTGECVCSAGYWGTSCNSSCPSGFHGNNCSIPCQCPEGLCHPVTGACQLGRHGKNALIAGILVPLLLLLLGVICCAYCCSAKRLAPKDRPERNGAALFRMKQQVWDTLTSLGAALPCGSLSNYKLPWVTALLSHPLPAGPRMTPSLLTLTLEKRTKVMPTPCHLEKRWSLWPKKSPQRPAFLEAHSLPLRTLPHHSPSHALPAWLGPRGHLSPLLKALSLHHRMAEALGISPAPYENPRDSPEVLSHVLKGRRLGSLQAQNKQMWKRMQLPPQAPEMLPPVTTSSHLLTGQWLGVWKPPMAASRRAQALWPQSTCWQGHPRNLRALSGLSSVVWETTRKIRQCPRSRVPSLSLYAELWVGTRAALGCPRALVQLQMPCSLEP
ncbi:scavenger receptor class F member 1 isoform X2 [Microtus oregoni]|uniref:scavenger receptor class F member 1 isoform X2 n=1 Tax=Microtus oregoni TaxID=111838 RepID=UPI001BB16D18|nr:scavenger receptor class F member 1 isoform X2 [Microtus oregoni]